MKNNNSKNHSPTVPISASPTAPPSRSEKCYPNSETSKAKILLENTNKSGIYKWTNLINGKQ